MEVEPRFGIKSLLADCNVQSPQDIACGADLVRYAFGHRRTEQSAVCLTFKQHDDTDGTQVAFLDVESFAARCTE